MKKFDCMLFIVNGEETEEKIVSLQEIKAQAKKSAAKVAFETGLQYPGCDVTWQLIPAQEVEDNAKYNAAVSVLQNGKEIDFRYLKVAESKSNATQIAKNTATQLSSDYPNGEFKLYLYPVAEIKPFGDVLKEILSKRVTTPLAKANIGFLQAIENLEKLVTFKTVKTKKGQEIEQGELFA